MPFIHDDRYRSRKFILTSTASISATLMVFFGFMDASVWVAAQTLVLSQYSFANINDKQ